ncbi:hypothetical protein ABZ756_13980 [Mammaliicoccus sciuri]|uniref:Ribosomal protein L7/L12 C-terminal domain-containing protein n=1 Tax=Sporosarcina newyorkensis TaxID=759851 RepID=A0A1T4YT92_9BACL|nr:MULTISPECIES: hypothetical protein [Sporosarcina]SKB05009.1 hypothetical protein SAMN04244570_3523 [Sporosarcina newyorkensis]
MNIILLVSVIVVFGFLILTKLDAIERRLARQQSMLNQLTQNFPEPPANDEILSLIHAGESIKAVKLSREMYGFSLLEAKEYVDRLKEDI